MFLVKGVEGEKADMESLETQNGPVPKIIGFWTR